MTDTFKELSEKLRAALELSVENAAEPQYKWLRPGPFNLATLRRLSKLSHDDMLDFAQGRGSPSPFPENMKDLSAWVSLLTHLQEMSRGTPTAEQHYSNV